MSNKKKIIQANFDYILKDFESDANPGAELEELAGGLTLRREARITFPPNQIDIHPYIVFIIFVYLKKFEFAGRWEKVAWEIQIKFKGTPFMLTHRKFGFRIIAYSESELISQRGVEAIEQIKKAIPLAEELIEPLIKSTVNARNITLANEYINIENRYHFFRKKAEHEFSKYDKMEKADKPKLEGGLSDLFKSHNESMDRLQEGNYYLIAMLDSYFSLLEHAFVLLLPLLDNKELGEVNMETFIGYNWKDKYKAIFPLTSDKEVWQLLERLDKIKEQLRNPLTHGYFLKKGNSFYAHMDHLGAIPVTLTKTNNKLKYFFGAITPLTFKEICKCFDDCDEFLSNHSLTKFGMQYIKSGLSVAFDKSSSNKYRSAMVSQELFDQFIDYIGCQQDDAANMDW